jgi:hypothetical protein
VQAQDFGSGLSLDDVIGLPAWQIHDLRLPRGEGYQGIRRAAEVLVRHGLERFQLAEIWGDGHSVWRNPDGGETAQVTPAGQLNIPEM